VIVERFTSAVGLSPIRYRSAWRMELAAQRLEATSDPIAEVSLASGYDSEASFSRAFKRHTGEPPAAWRRHHQALPSATG
jgi:AraC family transcriptional regulator, alkane utilization regulator